MLVPGTRATHGQWFAALVDRLRELGWIEGRTVAFEYRFAEGYTDRYAEIVADLLRMKVDLMSERGNLEPAPERKRDEIAGSSPRKPALPARTRSTGRKHVPVSTRRRAILPRIARADMANHNTENCLLAGTYVVFRT